MEIRCATLDDAKEFAEVEALCFPPAETASEETIRGRIAAYGDQIWLLFEDGKLAAYVGGMASDEPDLIDEMYKTPSLHDPNGAWHMSLMLGVRPEFRGRRYGSTLLRRSIEDARARGRKGFVGCCKDYKLDYFAAHGMVDEGVTDKSVLGGAEWHQIRLTF